jgi:hypothetical protein
LISKVKGLENPSRYGSRLPHGKVHLRTVPLNPASRLRPSDREPIQTLTCTAFLGDPTKTYLPDPFAMWEKPMSRSHHAVPEFKIIERRVHIHPENETIARPIIQANGNDPLWAGAIVPSPPTGYLFAQVNSTFIIPTAYPTAKVKGVGPNDTINLNNFIMKRFVSDDVDIKLIYIN